jgi:DNA-directed RNA polymerase subunit N (RpoN/RPB10)
MFPYIRCGCGVSLGDYYDAIKLIRQNKIAAFMSSVITSEFVSRPDMIMVGNDISIDLEEELDALGFTLDCCRMKQTTAVEYSELY